MRQVLVGLVVAFVAFASAPTADARNWPGLRMGGPRLQPVMWTWAADASQNVPLPQARFTVWPGDPEYLPDMGMMFVPKTQDGWTGRSVQGLFLHELGHVYDATMMTPARRDAFKVAAGTTCRWNAKHCLSNRWVTSPTEMVDVAPVEMFAEMYAACALGLTERAYGEAGFNTYGWVPPQGTDDALCDLIG